MSATPSVRAPRLSTEFNAAHAFSTRQMMAELQSTQRPGHFAEIEPVAVITGGTDRATEFMHPTLGELETAGHRMRETEAPVHQEILTTQVTITSGRPTGPGRKPGSAQQQRQNSLDQGDAHLQFLTH